MTLERVGVAALAACSLASGCLSPRAVEDAIVFQPAPYPAGDWLAGPGLEDAWVGSSGGVTLHGWFAEAKQPRAVVLYTHGNGGNITSRRGVLRLYRDRLNTSVLVFDYRGYGRSTGVPTEGGVLDDARAARRWLALRTGVREADIVLVGHSLGGGVAVDLAARDGARGLVLEGTFTNLPDVAFSHVPLLPYHLFMRNRLDSIAKIASYQGPLLQAHGDADRIVRFELGRELFEAANEPKRFVPVQGCGHNDLHYREEYVAAVDQFLAALPTRN
jgi:fermentation-respiration switch protein FrsA (DUF1100 family)